jgi:hypothetical protein
VSVSLDWIFQWRESLEDGVYSVPGFLIVPAGNSRERFVGHRPGTEIHWQINRHLWAQADYGIFYAGKFLKAQSPGRNLTIGRCGLGISFRYRWFVVRRKIFTRRRRGGHLLRHCEVAAFGILDSQYGEIVM